MNIRHSRTRRKFSVATAGWFTVLKPDLRFPALRLRSGFRDSSSQSVGTIAVDHVDSRETANSLQIMMPAAADRRLMRPALIVLTAMMITLGLLLWIMHP